MTPSFNVYSKSSPNEDTPVEFDIKELYEPCLEVFKRGGPEHDKVPKDCWTIVGMLCGHALENPARPHKNDEPEVLELHDTDRIIDKMDDFQGELWCIIEGLCWIIIHPYFYTFVLLYFCSVALLYIYSFVLLYFSTCEQTDCRTSKQKKRVPNHGLEYTSQHCICGLTLNWATSAVIYENWKHARKTCCYCKRAWGPKSYFRNIFHCGHKTGQVVHPRQFSSCGICYPPSRNSPLFKSMNLAKKTKLEQLNYQTMANAKTRNNKRLMEEHFQKIKSEMKVCS